jgi:hypothetical protein
VHIGFVFACNLLITMVACEMFRSVNKPLARLAVMFVLLSNAVEAVSLVHHVTALDALTNPTLAAFSEAQRAALATLSVETYLNAFAIALLLFGGDLIVIGFLIAKSGLLPRVIGVLLMIAGVCYTANSFLVFLAPALQASLFPLILAPCLIGEGAYALWLLARGVDVPRWERLRADQWQSGPTPSARTAGRDAGLDLAFTTAHAALRADRPGRAARDCPDEAVAPVITAGERANRASRRRAARGAIGAARRGQGRVHRVAAAGGQRGSAQHRRRVSRNGLNPDRRGRARPPHGRRARFGERVDRIGAEGAGRVSGQIDLVGVGAVGGAGLGPGFGLGAGDKLRTGLGREFALRCGSAAGFGAQGGGVIVAAGHDHDRRHQPRAEQSGAGDGVGIGFFHRIALLEVTGPS